MPIPPKKKKRPLRTRRQPYVEGSVPQIYSLFIKPLLRYRPNNLSTAFWKDILFALEGREVKQYEAIEPIIIPGRLINRVVVGTAPELREVPVGGRLFIRTEEDRDFAEVEHAADADCFERVFKVSNDDLPAILKRVVEKPAMGRREVFEK